MFKIFLIAGARPNFVKIAAIAKAFRKYAARSKKFSYHVINTGQHYDYLMSKKLFIDLGIPKPYADLNVGSGPHGAQTGKIMSSFEELCVKDRPDLVIVVGDVNSTMGCALVAVKLGIPVVHVESGLRSLDRTMPEEINRIVTDSISDILMTTSKDANANLRREGVSSQKTFLVGNVMVDTLLHNLKTSRSSRIKDQLRVKKNQYAVLTLHRPSNVDDAKDFSEILKAIDFLQAKMPVIFPVHPRTEAKLKSGTIGQRVKEMKNLILCPPCGYHDFICLLDSARLVYTDSGGVQEETSVLGVPCLTLRDNTERPVTISSGSNILAGRKSKKIIQLTQRILQSSNLRNPKRPPFWDGKASDRIVKILAKQFSF